MPGGQSAQQDPNAVGAQQQPVFQLDHMPSPGEMATLPPEMQITTPYGAVTRDGRLIPSPEGVAQYQQAIVTARKNFGPHPFADDPNAPSLPLKLGRSMYNPWTNRWGRA